MSWSIRYRVALVAWTLAVAAAVPLLSVGAQSLNGRVVAPSPDSAAPVTGVADGARRATLAGPRAAPAAIDLRMPRGEQAVQREPGMGVGPNVALMGAGVAAIIVGLLIGGDGGTIIALTGGAVSLVGLYRFLR